MRRKMRLISKCVIIILCWLCSAKLIADIYTHQQNITYSLKIKQTKTETDRSLRDIARHLPLNFLAPPAEITTVDDLENQTLQQGINSILSLGSSTGYFKATNFVEPASTSGDDSNDVTFVTHGTMKYLHRLVELSEQWNSPISVAVFASNSDIPKYVPIIFHLSYCYPHVRQFVSIHLLMNSVKAFKKDTEQFISDSYSEGISWPCDQNILRKKCGAQSEDYSWYPMNVARNLARVNAKTHRIFTIDIEFTPSRNLVPMFTAMLANPDSSSKALIRRHLPHVFVVPGFEVQGGDDIPRTKPDLLNKLSNGKIFTFHASTCPACHQIPQFERWKTVKANGSDTMDVFYVNKWIQPYWEPIYLGTKADPLYDELFKGYGFNKIQQLLEMCYADYHFLVLDNAFVVHNGRPATDKASLRARRSHNVRNAGLLRSFVTALSKRYPSQPKRRCSPYNLKDATLVDGYFP